MDTNVDTTQYQNVDTPSKPNHAASGYPCIPTVVAVVCVHVYLITQGTVYLTQTHILKALIPNDEHLEAALGGALLLQHNTSMSPLLGHPLATRKTHNTTGNFSSGSGDELRGIGSRPILVR